MNIELLLFASAKDLFGESQIPLKLPTGATIADLKSALIKRQPEAASLIGRCAFSVDQQYATDDMELNPHHEIAMIPPVSGG